MNRGARAKGAVVQSTVTFARAHLGDDAWQAVLGRLAETDRVIVEHAEATGDLPYITLVHLWEALDAEMLAQDHGAEWIERAGETSIGSLGLQLYGGILRKPTPREFLTQSISLFRLFYHPGDMEVVEDEPGRAVLRLVGFDALTPLFCRRLTGGLRQAITLAGGGEPRVRHVRCVLEEDAFCEWELAWQQDPPANATPAGARSVP